MLPKTSIIIPTHHRPDLLARAIESARTAGQDVEIIVVDDASVDGTAEVCRALQDIKYIRLAHNLGVAGARNVGLLASSSEYIAFLDDDDLRLAGSLDVQFASLLAHPEAGFCCGSILFADQNGRLTGEKVTPGHPSGDVFWQLLELNFPVLPISVLIRKSCFLQIGLFRNCLSGIDDWDMFVRIAELYPVVVIDDPVSVYRRPTPLSGQGSSKEGMHLTRAIGHQQQLFGLPRAREVPARIRKEVRRRSARRVADTLLWNAAHNLPRGSTRFICANIIAAMKLDPFRAARPSAYGQLLAQLRRWYTHGEIQRLRQNPWNN